MASSVPGIPNPVASVSNIFEVKLYFINEPENDCV